MANQFISQLQETADGFLNALSFFDDEQINTVPFAGSWTPGQVGEHILIAASGSVLALNGPSKPADRDPELQVEPLTSLFLNFDIKMQGPDFVQPTDKPKDRVQLLASLQQSMDSLIKFVKTHNDLTPICTAFEMPQFGYLTWTELLSFQAAHTIRHTRQLQKMVAYFPVEAK